MPEQPIQMTPTEVIRVHVPGNHYDYPADDVTITREGMTVWKSLPNGSRQTLAHFAPGQYLRAERVAADTPPPRSGPFVA